MFQYSWQKLYQENKTKCHAVQLIGVVGEKHLPTATDRMVQLIGSFFYRRQESFVKIFHKAGTGSTVNTGLVLLSTVGSLLLL